MAVVLQCIGLASGEDWGPAGMYLASCDPEAEDGAATFTRDVAAALRFPDFAAAHRVYGRRSARHPTRPDGTVNRPLMRYAMLCTPVPDA